jgi:hypothetical protein
MDYSWPTYEMMIMTYRCTYTSTFFNNTQNEIENDRCIIYDKNENK